MLRLRNKTRGASKVGYLVKVVRGGFEYAGAGDTPIGIVTEIVPSGDFCNIQTEGRAKVYVGETVQEGQQLRLKNADERLPAGQSAPVGDESVYVSIGYAIGKGRGLVEATLNIGSVAGSGGGVSSHLDLTNIGVNTHAQIDAFISGGSYSEWNIVDGIFDMAVLDGDQVEFLSGTDMTVQYSDVAGVHTITISYTPLVTPGYMDDWYLNVNTGADHVIQNHTQVDFKSGTYATATYGFSAPRHEVIVDVNLTALNTHYDSRYYQQSEVYTQTYIDNNFDDYNGWEYEYDTVTPQSVTITSGLSFGLVPGTGIGFAWDGANRRQTINCTITQGMDNWYLNTDHVDSPKSIQDDAEVYLIGGTDIDLTEVTWNSSDLRWEMTINATLLWTQSGSDIYYNTGDVGIGIATPEALLHVKAADTVTGVIKIEGGKDTVTSIGEINAQLDFGSNDASVNNTGNIGGRIASVTEATNGALVGMAFYTFVQGGSPDLAEHMRITNLGKVGIGTDSPSNFLHVYADDRDIVTFESKDATYSRVVLEHENNADMQLCFSKQASTKWSLGNNADNDAFVIRRGFGAFGTNDHFWILTTGNAYFSHGVYAAGEIESYDTSDIRFKDIIEDLDIQQTAEAILGLRTFRYTQKGEDRIRLGVSAQEVQQVFPENVKEDGDGKLLVHYGKMVPALIATIQRQQEQIDEFARKLAKY